MSTTIATDTRTVLIVDDHPVVLEAVSSAVENSGQFAVLTARSGPEALAVYAQQQPTVVLCDIRLSAEMSGIELTRRLTSADAGARVVMFTSHCEDDKVAAAVDAGANGYITKATAPKDMVAMLVQAAAGIPVFDPVIAGAMTRLFRNRDAAPRKSLLTPREMDVLTLLCNEVVNTRDIAATLFISEHTCRTHLEGLYSKLGVTSKTAAVARALKSGMVETSALVTADGLPASAR